MDKVLGLHVIIEDLSYLNDGSSMSIFVGDREGIVIDHRKSDRAVRY